MIIGLPRSMTTWAANWLSGDRLLVVHDPLYRAHYTEWDGRYDAVSCTGIWRWPEWVNAQSCRKLILRRSEADVASSLKRMGAAMHVPVEGGDAVLDRIQGPNTRHVSSADLLDGKIAESIWAWLRPESPFDAFRHDEMTRWKVEPHLPAAVGSNDALLARLLFELNANRELLEGAKCLGL